MTNAANIEMKKIVVQEIESLIRKSPLMIFADYRGTTVDGISGLRNQLRIPGVTAKVFKNTMLTFALKNCGYDNFSEQLAGPNLIIFSETELVEPAKILNKFSQGNKNFIIKFGILEGRLLDEADVKALAELPSKEELLSQVLGTMQAPITGFVRVLNANITGFVRALDQIREQKAS